MFITRALVVMFVTITALLIPVSANAEEKVSCWGNSCVGLDPDKTVCAYDAVSLDARVLSDGNIHLRWSKNCGAGWIRYSSSWRSELANGDETGIVHIQTAAWSLNMGPTPVQNNETGGRVYGLLGSSWWSGMVDARSGFCGKAASSEGGRTWVEYATLY